MKNLTFCYFILIIQHIQLLLKITLDKIVNIFLKVDYS